MKFFSPVVEKAIVLVVDDDRDLLFLTKEYLESSGRFEVRTTDEPRDEIENILKGDYDAVISDYEMPGLNGIDLLKMLRGRSCAIPFGIFTGRGREEVVIEALNSGADFYLQKGADPRSMFKELEHIIGIAVLGRRMKVRIQQNDEEVASALEELRATEESLIERNVELERKEKLLIESTERYSTLFKEMMVGCAVHEIICDSEGRPIDYRFLDINPAFEHMTGLSRETTIGRTIKEIMPDIEDYWIAIYGMVAQKGEKIHFENFAAPLGRYYECSAFRPKQGHFAVTFVDITERKRIEEELKRSEALYRSFITGSPDGITVSDEKGIITFLSKRSMELFSIQDPSQGVGHSVTEFIEAPERERAKENLMRAAGSGCSPSNRYTALRADGTRFTAEINTSPFIGPEGNTIGYVSTIRDASVQKRMEQALIRSNDKLNILSSITRHDMLNRLTVLTGYLEIAKRSNDVAKIHECLEKMETVTSTVQKQAKFTKEYQDIGIENPVWNDLERIIDETVAQFEIGNIEISREAMPFEIYADPMMKKVIYALIENTLMHGKRVTKIKLYCIKEENGLRLIYEDDGIGIPEEQKDHIFLKGFGQNSGLGLFLAREIMSMTDIQIKETGTPLQGCRFEIGIPFVCVRSKGRSSGLV